MTCEWKIFCKQGDTCVAHDGYDILRCTAFKDKEIPMTNEEYIKSLDTEQLATFLAIVQYDGTDLTLKKNHVEKWVAWLKEKHE